MLDLDCIEFLCKLLTIEPEQRLSAFGAYDDDYFRHPPRACPPGEIPLLDKDTHEYETKQEKKKLNLEKERLERAVDKISDATDRYTTQGKRNNRESFNQSQRGRYSKDSETYHLGHKRAKHTE